MKKYISMMAMALMLCMSFTACDVETDEKPGGTNIQDMCGNWDVAWYAVDASGNILDEEPWTEGTIFTFNKADNGTTQMWISDQDTYWAFQFLVNIDYAAKTFSAPATYYGPDMEEIAALIASGVTTDSKGNPLVAGQATVTNGKIMLGAGKNIHGVACDSISFEISFTDDNYPAKNGFDHYRVEGKKYSGFTE